MNKGLKIFAWLVLIADLAFGFYHGFTNPRPTTCLTGTFCSAVGGFLFGLLIK